MTTEADDLSSWMDSTCRVALAAMLHDLGKLAQRAEVFTKTDPRWDGHVQTYCPFQTDGGYHSHTHAAFTALAFDQIEALLPSVLHGDVAPFAARGDNTDPTDSFVNAAAMHHKPDTGLQWCVAVADRVSSGFERDAFETYNNARDQHFNERLLVPFEEIHQPRATAAAALEHRYPLKPLSVSALFPSAMGKAPDTSQSVAEYRALWGHFLQGLKLIPVSHRASWPLWLDAFDSLWLSATHAVPSATAFGARPDVSLYDHSRSTAAFAAAIWRFHAEGGEDLAAFAAEQSGRADWDRDKLLLIQGDFSGIQTFIFGGVASSQKGAAKLMRGRSAFVSLLCELAALRILQDLALPPTAQIINAAGKFLIVAPNTGSARRALERSKAALDDWFLKTSFGLASIVVASRPASCNDFIGGRFGSLRRDLAACLDRAKRRRFGFGGPDPAAAHLPTQYPNGVCAHDSRLPATHQMNGQWVSSLTKDQIALGGWLARQHKPFLSIERGEAGGAGEALANQPFGFKVRLLDRPDDAATPVRIFDLALPPADPNGDVFAGFARRAINAYVPVLRHDPAADHRYQGVSESAERGDLKTFEHLARDAQTISKDGAVFGVAALGVLKGDIDDLGRLFATATGDGATFAGWASLSRRVNSFFAMVVPQMCAATPQFQDVYTVFAGGDDFFFLGPWRTIKDFAQAIRDVFSKYCAQNPYLHFSAAYLMVKPGFPLRLVSERIETGLERAKAHEQDGKRKNALDLGARENSLTLSWPRYALHAAQRDELNRLVQDYRLETAYLYDLLQLCGLAEKADPRGGSYDIAATRWRSMLTYRTRRHLRDQMNLKDAELERALGTLMDALAVKGLGTDPAGFRHVVSDHLYAARAR